MKALPLALALSTVSTIAFAAPPEPKFRAQDLDLKIEIGYGLAVADVDGDGKPDILLADKKQFVWYRNPGKRGVAWDKFVLAENLTEKDNVCIAARDIDGSGKCSIAVGAEWNPGDTVNSGAVFYLIPPADRTQKWEAVKFPSVEPTTHRMKWVQRGKNEDGKPRYDLVVVPLHGLGNKNGEGAGVKVLAYQMPKNPRDEWKAEVICADLHMTHNFDLLTDAHDSAQSGLIIGGREGIRRLVREKDGWANLAKHSWGKEGRVGLEGIGEVRESHSQGFKGSFLATIEPMHGNRLMVYPNQWATDVPPYDRGILLTDKLADGHALACGDMLGTGSDQIVVGWRAMGKPGVKVGVALWTSLDDNDDPLSLPREGKAARWRESLIDDNTMACEDLVLADLDGDGKLDIVAAGRATKNVKIYWNER